MRKLILAFLVFQLYSDPFAYGSSNAGQIKVMTFNIRYGTARDGENSWEFRKDIVVETIKRFSPDVLGLQEALDFQIEYIQKKVPEYSWIGVGREDGRRKGEFSPIFFKKDLLCVLLWGTFWLSETPQIPGSKSWDSALPRIVTWARFGFKEGSGKVLYVFNTHFDHRGSVARLESSRILRKWVDFVGPSRNIVLTGDFNAFVDSEPYKALLQPEEKSFPMVTLLDCYALLNRNEPEGGEGTFHGFSGKARPGRIDWILCSESLKPVRAEVVRYNKSGRYPSDHFPVWAELRLPLR